LKEVEIFYTFREERGRKRNKRYNSASPQQMIQRDIVLPSKLKE